jgi:hypothetical protein
VNLNVRGKRGNIVQCYPAVEYDFVPNELPVGKSDLVHLQWTGSNTHNNGSPGGDGQTGDDGQGKKGRITAVFHGVSLGPTIPYHSKPCGKPTPSQPIGRPRVGRPKSVFSILDFGLSPGYPIKHGHGGRLHTVHN